MKKAIIFSFMLVLVLGLFSCNGKKSKGAGKVLSQEASSKDSEYVDLGLPSGTLWKNSNEGGDDALYTYDEAVSMFGDKLPTKEQFEELKNECTWTWIGNGYEVTGPNGKSITLPAAGMCDGSNVYDVQFYGYYWSTAEDNSDDAYCLSFGLVEVSMYDYFSRQCGRSVRLVQ